VKKFLAVVSILIVLSSCASPSSFVKKVTQAEVAKNVLTNLPGTNGPVLAVKIDDTNAAHPQVGLNSADVIYIEQVEGGLTRLAAIFTDKIPDLIGPVRSARISDIEILEQYGRVGFAYSGAQSKMRPILAAANLENMSAERNPPSIYQSDKTRYAPTNMMVDAKALLKKTIEDEGKKIDTVKSIGWQFGKGSELAKDLASAEVKWPAAKYGMTWSKSEKRWLLTFNGKPNLDSNGRQLGSANFVIQKVAITDSIYGDKFGGVTPMSNTVGSGTGYLLRDGKIVSIKWERPSARVGTIWTLADGTVANFADGQVWIALTDTEPKFEYPAPAESASPQK
jgi:outer membrane lipoprotein SlyB